MSFRMDKLLSGRRILVVEDEILILMMIEGMLADLGCESMSAAATNEAALALIDTQLFDAAMLDLNLNGKSSYAVADALIARDVPFIFSTGNSVSDLRDGYRDWAVLRKPFTDEELIKELSRLLPRAGLSKSEWATQPYIV
jgi:CheY-like chemotaxis protein